MLAAGRSGAESCARVAGLRLHAMQVLVGTQIEI